MKSAIISTLMGAALLMQPTIAHPGDSAEQTAKDMAQRRSYLNENKRSLAHCADQLKARGNDIAMHQRRSAALEQLRAKRSIEASKPLLRARDLASVLNTTHLYAGDDINADTDPETLFAGNKSCILTPDVTQGPYYVSGEYVRDDMSEDQQGVPLTLNLQIIDVNTCEPVPATYLELWHCNSTGVYSGVVASGNGDITDLTNLDKTFNRGISVSDDSGVVVMESTFPGHYTGRAPHIHVVTHNPNATLLANDTLAGNTVSHVGQIFFDDDLIALVETQEPYVSNTQDLTLNADDGILGEEAATVDPFVEYVLVGDDISEGVFGWISFGVNTTLSSAITGAATLTENGGVANPNFGGGGGGGPPGNMTGRPSATASAGGSTLTTVVSSTSSVAAYS